MENKKFDWTFFRKRIYINNCNKKDLFRKWVTPKGLTEWFIAEAEYKCGNGKTRNPDEIVQPGDRYNWKFHKGSTVSGKVLEVKENSLFKFTFGEQEPGSLQEVIVTVMIREKNGFCSFDILQDNMTGSKYSKVYSYISCNMGWMFHMNNLKSIYETGYDLRATGVDRMHVDAPSAYPLEQYKWTEFRQKEYFSLPKQVVFDQWTTAENIVKWFVAKASYNYDGSGLRNPQERIMKGDKYTWVFHQDFKIEGKIIDVVENEFLAFTFGKKEPGSDEDVIVEIGFFDEPGNQSRIELFQKNIADNEYGQVHFNLSCMIGWCYFLTNLRSVLESGYDLREKEKSLAEETRAYSLKRY